ncbi:MAG: ShlB/FhaC/HecB family hemolysin secretion/activation protein [Rhodocyclaceae bacterium]|nr:ShlB/FhaC/HecB family hemolysin secretion/activation protein [Rhodocyclaceae bacterium]
MRPAPILSALIPFGFLLLLMSVPKSACATLEPADRLLDEQRRGQRTQQIEAPALPSGSTTLAPLTTQPSEIDESGPVVNPATVRIDAHALLSTAHLAVITAPFEGLALGRQRIALLIRQLDAQLVEAGWVTSRARLVGIDWRRGEVNIELVPGRVEAIHTAVPEAAAVARVLPVAQGDVLALEALEQGVQQINRLRMYQAQVQIKPGDVIGGSVLDIRLKAGRPWRASIGVDNQGQRSTGSGRLRLQGHLENTLGLFDDIHLAVVGTERSHTLLASIAIPQGFNTWSATVSGSESSSSLLGLDYTSRALSIALGWNRVLSLSKEGRDALDLTLTRSRAARTLVSTHLDTERSAVARLSWSRLRQGAGYQYYIEPGLSLGLPILGAREDAAHLSRMHVHRQFTKLSFNAGAIARPNQDVEIASQCSAQRAEVSLIGAEQLSLGGMASVRGFEESALSGDTGYLIRTEARFLTAFVQRQFTPVPFIHLDHGSSWLSGRARHTLSSLGVGIRGIGNGLTWETVLAAPLRHSPDIDRHAWRLHATLSYEF